MGLAGGNMLLKAVDHAVSWIYGYARSKHETVLKACTNPDRSLSEVKQ